MDLNEITIQFVLGVIGALIAVLFDLIVKYNFNIKNWNLDDKVIFMKMIIIILSGILTVFYFSFLEPSKPLMSILINYGLFIALVVEEIIRRNKVDIEGDLEAGADSDSETTSPVFMFAI